MEAAPKLQMMSFDFIVPPDKEKRYPDLAGAVERFILARHQDDPGTYTDELRQLRELQRQAYQVPRNTEGLKTLKRYLGQLKVLQARFPLGASTTDVACDNLQFTWYDAFSGQKISSSGIRLEETCIMHNIAAFHSYLGADSARSTAEQMKQSCSHFQYAAWAFEQVKTMYSPAESSDSPCIPSLSKGYLNYARLLMLAQAQECILEKSLLDSRKPTTIAKVAAQVVQYYSEAERVSLEQCSDLRNAPAAAVLFADLVSLIDCIPTKYLQFKQHYYKAFVYYACGCRADDAREMGISVAYFAEAQKELEAATKTIHKTDEAARCAEALQFVGDVVGTKLQAAKKENAFIYYENVPETAALSQVECANLVKPMPFDVVDPAIASGNVDIFHKLIPMSVYEQLSIYSERKMDKFRQLLAGVEQKNQLLAEFMSSIDVESLKMFRKSEQNDRSEDSLPQEVLDACADVSGAPKSAAEMKIILTELEKTSNELAQHLSTTRNVIVERGVAAERELAVLRSNGKRPDLQFNAILAQLEQYELAHAKATNANAETEKVLHANFSDWKLLAAHVDEVGRQVPKFSLMDAPNVDEQLRKLDGLIDKVHEMKRQRDVFVEELRSAMDADDIRQAVMLAMSPNGGGGNFEAVFERELKKFQPKIDLLEQNMRAQETIIDALVDANAKCAELRQYVVETTGSRDKRIRQLLSAAALFDETSRKVEAGEKFYPDFRQRIVALEDQVRQKLQQFEAYKAKAAEEEKKRLQQATASAQVPPAMPNFPVVANPPPAVANSAGMTLGDYMKHMKLSSYSSGGGGGMPKLQQNHNNNNAENQFDAAAAAALSALHALPPASSSGAVLSRGFSLPQALPQSHQHRTQVNSNPYQQFQPRDAAQQRSQFISSTLPVVSLPYNMPSSQPMSTASILPSAPPNTAPPQLQQKHQPPPQWLPSNSPYTPSATHQYMNGPVNSPLRPVFPTFPYSHVQPQQQQHSAQYNPPPAASYQTYRNSTPSSTGAGSVNQQQRQIRADAGRNITPNISSSDGGGAVVYRQQMPQQQQFQPPNNAGGLVNFGSAFNNQPAQQQQYQHGMQTYAQPPVPPHVQQQPPVSAAHVTGLAQLPQPPQQQYQPDDRRLSDVNYHYAATGVNYANMQPTTHAGTAAISAPPHDNASSRYSAILSPGGGRNISAAVAAAMTTTTTPPVVMSNGNSRSFGPPQQQHQRMTAYSSLINNNINSNVPSPSEMTPMPNAAAKASWPPAAMPMGTGSLVSSYAQLLLGETAAGKHQPSPGSAAYQQPPQQQQFSQPQPSYQLAGSMQPNQTLAYMSQQYQPPGRSGASLAHYDDGVNVQPHNDSSSAAVRNGYSHNVTTTNSDIKFANGTGGSTEAVVPAASKKLLPSSDLDELMGWSSLTIGDDAKAVVNGSKSGGTKHMVDLLQMPLAPPDPNSLL